jgi:hypothetical protein
VDAGRTPGRRVHRVIDFADSRSESAGESITRVLMADGRLPRPALNVWIGNDRVDFLFEESFPDSDPDSARRADA